MNPEAKICRNCKNGFTIESEDFAFYEKIEVPPPTFCPDCRLQRRMLFRNERTFYKRTCDLCGKDIISSYAPEYTGPVYCQKCWWSDKWDPYSYGRDFDFSRPFFEQFKELFREAPVINIMNDDTVASTNCEYSYDWGFRKNIYLCTDGWYDENCLYSKYLCYDKDVMDSFYVNHSELVYELISSNKCARSKFLTLCFDCHDCVLGYDLRGCSNCAMCVGLRNKQYCILNRQYSKEEYFKKLGELHLDDRASLEKHKSEFHEFVLRFPRKYAYNLKSVECVGNMVTESRKSKDCFYAAGLENCRFLLEIDQAKECYDCNNTGKPELCYECVTPDNSRGNRFSIFCWKCMSAEYSNNCHSCNNVFGSTGLKHTSYAILNKRYSKESFDKLKDKIVEHMKKTDELGEFFPAALSPFAYDESAALEWFPLTESAARAKGDSWRGEKTRDYSITKKPSELPDNIMEVDDSILKEVIGCAHEGACGEKCTTAFRVVPAELELYRKFNVPIPALCPNCRYYARLRMRDPAKLWHRHCACVGVTSENRIYKNTAAHFHGDTHCPNEFETSYAPERPEIVYCESCYNSEIV